MPCAIAVAVQLCLYRQYDLGSQQMQRIGGAEFIGLLGESRYSVLDSFNASTCFGGQYYFDGTNSAVVLVLIISPAMASRAGLGCSYLLGRFSGKDHIFLDVFFRAAGKGYL